MKLDVFDPPMCCSSGVCGPKVDPVLPRFAADLDWLRGQGVAVARYNLAQQPMAFADNETVKTALTEDENCLPLTLVEGKIACRGRYPTRSELARFAGVKIVAIPVVTVKQEACCGGASASGSASTCCA
ncbi:MAG: arsenite efflux transporter metallochaperone ArsD [Lentisphaerae bacterium]|nr:arsenite efflux transporter metallochaperone ArsD [Lentisphaerota bacterium]